MQVGFAVDLIGVFLEPMQVEPRLTHLPELVIDQLQPGHVQVVQVVAAEMRRPSAAPPLWPAVGLARHLRQQSGDKHNQQRMMRPLLSLVLLENRGMIETQVLILL